MEFFRLKGKSRELVADAIRGRYSYPMENTATAELIRETAHAVQTPLTSISGFAELLLEDESIQGQARENAQIIFDEAWRLADLLSEFFVEIRRNTDSSPATGD